jgi:hypothetical protein
LDSSSNVEGKQKPSRNRALNPKDWENAKQIFYGHTIIGNLNPKLASEIINIEITRGKTKIILGTSGVSREWLDFGNFIDDSYEEIDFVYTNRHRENTTLEFLYLNIVKGGK